jgi:hypothetical protein
LLEADGKIVADFSNRHTIWNAIGPVDYRTLALWVRSQLWRTSGRSRSERQTRDQEPTMSRGISIGYGGVFW